MTLESGSSAPYLATVRGLAQSEHLLQGLGHSLLPLVQKLPFPITEVKAKAQVKVPRAASGGVGLDTGSLFTGGEPQAKPVSTGADPHSMEPLRKIPLGTSHWEPDMLLVPHPD